MYVPKAQEGEADDPWGFDICGTTEAESLDIDVEDLWGSDLTPEEQETPDPDSALETEEHFWLHAYIFEDPTTEQLGKLRVWDEKDLIIAVPRILIEEMGVVLQVGDRVVVGKKNYELHEYIRWGFWRDTDRYLMGILNCKELTFDRKENEDAASNSATDK